jgi:hypothetical protein
LEGCHNECGTAKKQVNTHIQTHTNISVIITMDWTEDLYSDSK